MKFPTKRADWLLFLVMLLPIGLSIWLGLSQIDTIHRRQAAATLQTVLAATREALVTWERHTATTARSWASEVGIRRAILAQVKVRSEGGSLHESPHLGELRRLLRDVVQQKQFMGFDVIATDGIEIASDHGDVVGTNTLSRLDPLSVTTALRGSTVIGAPFVMHNKALDTDVPTMLAVTPVRDEEGTIVAALAFRLDPTGEFSRITRSGRVGETGETYAFDRHGRLMTESRFEPTLRDIGLLAVGERSSHAIELRDPGGDMLRGFRPGVPRSEQPLTKMAHSAVAGKSGLDIDGYRDYRGVEVIGAWIWDSELRLGIATEVDKAEAYSALAATRRVVLRTFLVGLCITFILTLLLQHRAKALVRGLARERELRSELEERVGRLQRVEGELKTAVHVREDFLRFASHELRTPLTSLRLLYEYMLRSRPEDATPVMSPADVNRFLKVSTRELYRMTQVINNMFVLSSVAAGNAVLNLEHVDLDELVRNVARKMQAEVAAEGCTVEIQSEGPVVGHWDRAHLEQVFVNLLSNAARFGSKQPITISIGKETGFAFVAVRDRGVGIPKEDQERMFEPFRRRQDAHAGLGAGLFVCRAIVEAHKGTISVSSEKGQGAIFRVQLPLPPGTEQA
ncbi:sensor histidine kinase [Polyangium sorediatum]|uniref:histidine kinase n=1 Tax=Polyangium sorediatum TaxID=889274 RepID=A0ABT6NMI1_9BACT|nr:sensor histidine kinase [Polyangium sorediatum]MDI1429531.1 sensor histidine kinase [Polyangium sorediatum]